MNFIETRGNDGSRPSSVTFSQAILSPLCSFGGIYVPESLPELGEPFLRAHLGSDYKSLARAVSLPAPRADNSMNASSVAMTYFKGIDRNGSRPNETNRQPDNLADSDAAEHLLSRLPAWPTRPSLMDAAPLK